MQKKLFHLQLTPKVAERVSRNNASLPDILFALFQDSQYARTSQVVINTTTVEGKTWLALSDDGEEIFANNILSLADNKRASKDTYSIRFARRISIFNLFNRGAIVESKKLSITLAPKNFPVDKDVQMRSSNVERGTKISFPISTDEITQLLRVVNCLSIFSSVEIVLNGSKFARNERVLAQV